MAERKTLPHVNSKVLDGRSAIQCPVCTNDEWVIWVSNQTGEIVSLEVPLYRRGAFLTNVDILSDEDLAYEAFELLAQHYSFPDIKPFSSALEDDFHLLTVSVHKLDYYFQNIQDIEPTLLYSYVRSELEHLLVIARSMFDLVQEIVSRFWNDHVELRDAEANALKKQRRIPRSYSKVVMAGDKVKTIVEIQDKYQLPPQLAEAFIKHAEFFIYLRKSRDVIVHGTKSVDTIFATERGFCVSPQAAPYSSYDWKSYHRYNDNLVSLKPWVGHIVLSTMQACTDLVGSLRFACEPPVKMFPEFHYVIRDPANPALSEILKSQSDSEYIAKKAAFWA